MRRKLLFCVTASWLALEAAACGPSLSYTVPDELLQRLPKKSRRSVFQAETVVTIAVDRKSAAKRDQESTRREIDAARERIASLEKEAAGASPDAKQKAQAEIQMLEAQIDYLEEKLDHLHLVFSVAEDELLLARAQFELAKLHLVKKHAIAFDGDEKDFSEQVEKIQRHVEKRRRELEQDAARLKREEEKFLEVKRRFFSSIGESSKGWWTE